MNLKNFSYFRLHGTLTYFVRGVGYKLLHQVLQVNSGLQSNMAELVNVREVKCYKARESPQIEDLIFRFEEKISNGYRSTF